MRSRLARVQTAIVSHPRLIASLLMLAVFLLATGSAAALDGGVALDGVTLGNETEVGPYDSGDAYGGPTDT
jgi:hypothetical protein